MSKADKLGAGAFAGATGVSARRAAIAGATQAPTAGAPVPQRVRLDLISENPANPRDSLGDLTGMENTLREVGQVNPITIATIDAYLQSHSDRSGDLATGALYVVVDGHRRLAAAANIGWPDIRITINDDLVVSDEKLLESAFVANVQRESMSEMEEAQALEQLVAFYGSQHKAAARLGVSQGFISTRLSLLALTPELQADLAAGDRKVAHVRGLAKLSPEKQREAADERVRKAEALAAKKRAERSGKTAVAGSDYGVITQPDPVAQVSAQSEGPATEVLTSAPSSASLSSSPVVTAVETEDSSTVALAGATVPSPNALLADDDSAANLPWHDPQAVGQIIMARMTPEDRLILAKLLT